MSKRPELRLRVSIDDVALVLLEGDRAEVVYSIPFDEYISLVNGNDKQELVSWREKWL